MGDADLYSMRIYDEHLREFVLDTLAQALELDEADAFYA